MAAALAITRAIGVRPGSTECVSTARRVSLPADLTASKPHRKEPHCSAGLNGVSAPLHKDTLHGSEPGTVPRGRI